MTFRKFWTLDKQSRPHILYAQDMRPAEKRERAVCHFVTLANSDLDIITKLPEAEYFNKNLHSREEDRLHHQQQRCFQRKYIVNGELFVGLFIKFSVYTHI